MVNANGNEVKCLVDRRLLKLKAVYFTFVAASGGLLPFIPIYMKQLGLTSTETGFLYGVMPFTAFFVRPVFGLIADKTHRHRLVLIICCILTGVCYNLLLLIPTKEAPNNPFSIHTGLQCSPKDSFIQDCETQHGVGVRNLTDRHQCDLSLQSFYDQFIVNQTDVRCDFNCLLYLKEATNVEVCFYNEGAHTTGDCDERLNLSKVSKLKYSINDLNQLMHNNVSVKGDILLLDQHCQSFNLTNISYGKTEFSKLVCDVSCHFHCMVTCNKQQIKSNSQCSNKISTDGYLSATFWYFFVIYLLCNIFFSPVATLLDAIAYDMIGKTSGRWGMQRLWGTIGYILSAIASTLIMYFTSSSIESTDYRIPFYIYLGLCVLAGIVSGGLEIDDSLQCSQVFKNITQLLHFPHVLFFLVMMLFFGIMDVAIEGFLFWYLEDLGCSQILLGVSIVFSCVPEIVMLFLSGRIIKKIGHVNCFYVCAFAYAVRFFYYSFMSDPWLVLVVQPLHGVTYALFYASASSYVSIISPSGVSGSVQGLLGGIYSGLARGVGSLITGKLFDRVDSIGPVWTFRFFGFFALFVLILYTAVQTVFFKKYKAILPDEKHEPENTTEEELLQIPTDGETTGER